LIYRILTHTEERYINLRTVKRHENINQCTENAN
jgi:hypothetical protein